MLNDGEVGTTLLAAGVVDVEIGALGRAATVVKRSCTAASKLR